MAKLFLMLLNRSICASWVVLAVIVLRLVLKKAPKAMRCALWALVAVRLLCPFSFESRLSLLPDSEPVSREVLSAPAAEVPQAGETNSAPDSIVDMPAAENNAPDTSVPAIDSQAASANTAVNWLETGGIIWAVGMALLLAYAALSYLRLKRKVRASIGLGGRGVPV